MTLPNAIIDGMSAIACLSADGLARAAEPITKGMVALALANLRKTISTSAKGRGVADLSSTDLLCLGVVFRVRLADSTGRIVQ